MLADGDVANNAATGGGWPDRPAPGPTGSINPLRQAQRFDRSGEYAAATCRNWPRLDRAWIQTPWKLPPSQRVRMGYPGPLVELA